MGVLDFDSYIKDAQRKVAILDTNLLILHVTGKVDPSLLLSFKRVKSFTPEDIIVLDWTLKQFADVATTAYVLTEASNLANELSGKKRQVWFEQLASYALVTRETHAPTAVLGSLPEAVDYGFADAALCFLNKETVLITTEYRLYGHLASRSGEVLNFNHLRSLWMLA